VRRIICARPPCCSRRPAGKTLATTRIELRHPVSDALLAFGSHTKFIGKAAGHPENVSE